MNTLIVGTYVLSDQFESIIEPKRLVAVDTPLPTFAILFLGFPHENIFVWTLWDNTPLLLTEYRNGGTQQHRSQLV